MLKMCISCHIISVCSYFVWVTIAMCASIYIHTYSGCVIISIAVKTTHDKVYLQFTGHILILWYSVRKTRFYLSS